MKGGMKIKPKKWKNCSPSAEGKSTHMTNSRGDAPKHPKSVSFDPKGQTEAQRLRRGEGQKWILRN